MTTKDAGGGHDIDLELESDRIGRIGERQFELLCERAGLFCNKSTVDIMGWDFIVEFPMGSGGHGRPPLDRPFATSTASARTASTGTPRPTTSSAPTSCSGSAFRASA